MWKCKVFDTYRLTCNLVNKINLERSDRYITLSFPISTTLGTHGNKTFRIADPKWKHGFELNDRSYSVSDIPDYFQYIIEQKTIANNPLVQN